MIVQPLAALLAVYRGFTVGVEGVLQGGQALRGVGAMSSRTYPYVGAMLVRSDSMTIEPMTTETRRGPVEVVEVRFRMYTGQASNGYQSGYQRRPCAWVEVESLAAGGKVAKRSCWRFGGGRVDKAEAEYDKCVREVTAQVRPTAATFPYEIPAPIAA